MSAGLAIGIAAALGLTFLIGERGLARSAALRPIAVTPQSLAQWIIGGVLLAAMLAALCHLVHPAIDGRVAALIGIVLAWLAQGFLLVRSRRVPNVRTTMWLLPCSLFPMLAAMASAHDARTSVLSGLAVALVVALGLPAFIVLAHRFDDSAVPDSMRPLPARLLATSILIVAMAGSLSW